MSFDTVYANIGNFKRLYVEDFYPALSDEQLVIVTESPSNTLVAQDVNCRVTKIGNVVTVTLNNFDAVEDLTTGAQFYKTTYVLPAVFRPTTDVYGFIMPINDDSGFPTNNEIGPCCRIKSNGSIEMGNIANADFGFNKAGVKLNILTFSVVYCN